MPEIEGIRFTNKNLVQQANGEVLNGICIGVESNLAASDDTNTCQGFVIRNSSFHGYAVCLNMDDCTNNNFDNVNFQNNDYAIFCGYSFDINTFNQCRFGTDNYVPGSKHQQVLIQSYVYNSPNNVKVATNKSIRNITFRDCWFMGVHDVLGDTDSQQVSFHNNYAEQIRSIGYGTNTSDTLHIDGFHFTSFPYQINFLNGEAAFSAATNTIFENNVNDILGNPKFAYLNVNHNNGNGDSIVPRLIWRNNRCTANDFTSAAVQDRGHIGFLTYDQTGANPVLNRKYCVFYDQYSNGTEFRRGLGNFEFIGMCQIGGEERVKHVGNLTGTFDPVTTVWRTYTITLTGPLTIRWPCGSIDLNEPLNRGDHQNYSANGVGDKRKIRGTSLKFYLTQDATGGRVVSFSAQYRLPGFNDGTGAAANSVSLLEFKWDGSKWRLAYPNVWSV
jgi:hypothetical protein